jgi:hypothetical protein
MSISLDALRGTRALESTSPPTILVEKSSASCWPTFEAQSREFSFRASIDAENANHEAEKPRATCDGC